MAVCVSPKPVMLSRLHLLVFIICSVCGLASTINLYVDANNGNDSNNGTSISSPFQTLGKAQSTVQTLISEGQPITVNIREGTYSFASSPWSFTTSDSGSSTSSFVLWTAYNYENVDIVAGVQIPSSSWAPVSSSGSAYVVDLSALNLTWAIGSLPGPNGLGDCNAIGGLELFFDGTSMNLARFPNIAKNGTWEWEIAGNEVNYLSFYYSGQEPSKWVNETNMRLHGYWSFDWADSWVEIESIDTAEQIIYINPNTPPLYNVSSGCRWMAINAYSELDTEGEYYIDKVNEQLYFIPPLGSSIETGSAWVSTGSIILNANVLKNVNFQGLNFLYSQQLGVQVQDATNVNFVSCSFANVGTYGLILYGQNSSVQNSSFYGNGCGGVSLDGGNQMSLTNGELSVVKNTLLNNSRLIRTYTPAISFNGVGNYLGWNNIKNGPHSGILGSGNNYIIEYNNLENLCYETTDAGAFYTGRSWSNWLNYLQHNSFSNIRFQEVGGGVATTAQVQAIYLDDQMSGWQVLNNSVVNAQVGVLLGGGRQNNITGNYFQDCDLAIYFDNRGMSWQTSYCEVGGTFNQELDALNYQQPPWSVEYPWLPNIFNEEPCVPVYNHFVNNTYCGLGPSGFIDQSLANINAWNDTFLNNDEITTC